MSCKNVLCGIDNFFVFHIIGLQFYGKLFAVLRFDVFNRL